jgi:hypothetical protein
MNNFVALYFGKSWMDHSDGVEVVGLEKRKGG